MLEPPVIAALTIRHDLAEAWFQQVGGRRTLLVVNAARQTWGEPAYGVHVLYTGSNLYWTGGWNAGMAHAMSQWPKAEYVWMCNDDIEGAYEGMADHLASILDRHQEVAMVSPTILHNPHPMMRPAYVSQERRPVTFVDGVCPMVRVAAWKNVGEFDTRFIGYGADIDWCVRARRLDWQLAVTDYEVIHHAHPGKTGVQDNGFERLLAEKYGGQHWMALRDGAK